ncbi:hypothetical protein EA187_18800 [Lujinxingia sediminis]|uniref:Histidine kinase n=1 Tax=Lujinxingia sediminis TaxID=2480984 RepID=A0ABY0CPC0_9DELT|nr:FIST N-terminal domain-containing protein [Lujinxingia sediminis]RVU41394.1 hypothetical protein EA187_18800 [Lujinxingia sediminis]
MKFASARSVARDPKVAAREGYRLLSERLEASPDIIFLYATETYDTAAVNAHLVALAGDVPIHGGTSCQGVMTDEGMASEEGHGLAMMGIADAEGAYGVGAWEIGDSPREAAQRALQEALSQAGRPGQVPQMLWLMAAPGVEEELIEGIQQLLGSRVPILGGSSADNTVAGHWKQFANGEVFENAVVIAAIFSSADVDYSFHSGYEPTARVGRVTRAQGRVLYEIDDQPAAQVYNAWTGGAIDDELEQGGNILGKTTLFPLGRVVGRIEGTPYYQLSHPDGLTPEGGLTLFSTVEEGEELVLMRGTVDSLISRAGRVGQAVRDIASSEDKEIVGSLVIYCAGCMLTVQERIDEVAREMGEVLGGKPYIGAFTFGEQGCFIGGENRHGNLMISVVTFLR